MLLFKTAPIKWLSYLLKGVFRGVPVLLVLVHAVRWDCWFLMKEKITITEFGIKASEQGAEREPKYPSCTPAQLSQQKQKQIFQLPKEIPVLM